MSSNKKVSNVLSDREEEVVITQLSKKKYLTKGVEKGTAELAESLGIFFVFCCLYISLQNEDM